MELIGHTLMTPYVESNVDPLSNITPTIRAMNNRGRSRSIGRCRNSGRNQMRSRSTSNNTRTSNLQDCNICGGQHQPNTIGCPHLYRQIQVQKWIDKSGQDIVDRKIHSMKNERRERSLSRDSSTSR